MEVASVSEFEKDLRKKKEGTDTLNQNQENSTKPAVPAEGENNAPAAPAKKKFAAVYRSQNSTQIARRETVHRADRDRQDRTTVPACR